MAKTTLTALEKKRKADLYARLTYAAILIVFLTVCSVAVFSTMAMEKNKEGFRAIKVTKPISFFDYTYVDESPTQHKAEQAKTP